MEGRTAQPVFPVCMYVQVCACRHVNSTCKQCLIRQLPHLENRSWEETDEVAALSWVSETCEPLCPHPTHSLSQREMPPGVGVGFKTCSRFPFCLLSLEVVKVFRAL